jgi:hypothetical protein
MAMIEFEDRDERSRLALQHYLKTGKPAPSAWRGVDLLAVAVSLVGSFGVGILALLR